MRQRNAAIKVKPRYLIIFTFFSLAQGGKVHTRVFLS
jgi:hypothetical protein